MSARLGMLRQRAKLKTVKENLAQKLLRLARLRHYEQLGRINHTILERSSMLLAKTKIYGL